MNSNSGSRTVRNDRILGLVQSVALPVLAGTLFWSLSFSAPNSRAEEIPPTPHTTHGFSIGESEALQKASPSPQPSLFPPRSLAVPIATPLLSPTVTPSEAKNLLKQYNKALSTEMASLKHRQKAELKELKAAHKAQLSEWEAKERDARHRYFAEHKTGPERRSYIQDYTRRRDLLLKIQSEDEDRRAREQSVRLDSLKSEQAQRLKEFQDFVSRNERPPANLWPN